MPKKRYTPVIPSRSCGRSTLWSRRARTSLTRSRQIGVSEGPPIIGGVKRLKADQVKRRKELEQ